MAAGNQFITYALSKPEVLVKEAPLRDPGDDLTWFNGVCQVLTKGQMGEILTQGTGFLFRFKSAQNEQISGFLTCYHIFRNDKDGFDYSEDTSRINLQFDSIKQSFVLSEIQMPDSKPFRFWYNDIYFVRVSEAIIPKLELLNLNFLLEGNCAQGQQIWVPQYPAGKMKIAMALPVATWNLDKRPTNLHGASTGEGSSGAPLLQLVRIGNSLERRVIGMHQGLWTDDRSLNLAIKIEAVLQDLKSLLRGETPCIPVHRYPSEFEARDGMQELRQ